MSIRGQGSARALASRLPDIETLRTWTRALAVLDAVVSPEWDYRYFSYNARWDEQEQLASMRNGMGDSWSITFTPAGAYLRGFDHESKLASAWQEPGRVWPGLLDDVPDALRAAALDPAWHYEGVSETTVSLWRLTSDDAWRFGEPVDAGAADGGDWLFRVLDGDPVTYVRFAASYFEQAVDPEVVRHVYAGRPVTRELALRLNPETDWSALSEELAEMGWPVT